MRNKSILQSLRFLTLLGLVVLGIGNAWGQTDVYYEQCTAVSDITNNGTYIIVISNGTNYYAVQQNSTNYVSITPETNGTIKNPSSLIIWTAGSTSTDNAFTFKCNNKYIYCSGSNTTLSAVGTNATTWLITKLKIGTNTFEMNIGNESGRYLSWSGSKYAAYATSNFKNQFASGQSFGQYSGALYIYKLKVNKTISSIAVKTPPTKIEYVAGENFNPAGLVITATYNDDSTEDINYAGNESKFTFEPSLSTALQTTDNSVTITYGEKTATQNITVTAATGKSVTCTAKPADGGSPTSTPSNNIAAGTEVILTANPSTGYTFTSWYAIDGDAQEITVTDNKFNMPATDVEVEANYTAIEVTEVTLNKSILSLEKGATETLTASITPSDALVQTVTWSSSDPTVATVDQTGKVTAVKKGTATITATSNNNVTGTCAVTVTAAQTWEKVTSAPDDWSGEYVLVYESSTTAYVWTGVDANKCKVTATITDNTISKPADAVSLTIAPMTGGYSIQINGGTNDGKYIGKATSGNGMDISDDALLNTLSHENSSTVITAAGGSKMRYNSASNTERFRYYGSGQQAVQLYRQSSTDPSITLNKTSTTIKAGATETLTATVKNSEATVVWTSSAEGIATVDQTGKVTGVAAGSATITAKITEGGVDYSATCEVTVTPAATVTSVTISPAEVTPIYIGKTTTLTASVIGENEPAQTVTWTSSDDNIASVNENGVVTGVAAGTVTITATSTADDTKSDTREVTIKTAINTPETAYTPAEAILLFDNKDNTDLGENKVYVKGIVSKVVTEYTTETGYLSFNVSLDGLTTGSQFQFYRNVKGNGVNWTDADIKPVVGDEVIGYGELTKYSTTYEFKKDNYLVKHVKTPTFSIANVNVTKGDPISPVVTTNNTDSYTIIYSSSNEDIVKVEDNVLSAVGVGSATITATMGATTNFKQAVTEFSVTVTSDAVLTALTINGDITNKTYTLGDALDFSGLTVDGTFVDKSSVVTHQDMTSAVTWTYTPNPLTFGTTTVTVTATIGEISNSKEITGIIVNKKASSITIANLTLYNGQEQTITATTVPVDATLSYEVTEGNDVVTYSNGKLKAIGAGNATVTATYTGSEEYAGTSATFSVTVEAASSIELSGSYKTTFLYGSEFTHEGAIVTAKYPNLADRNVTEEAQFSTPTMTTEGEQTVTVSYDDQVTSYTINILNQRVLFYESFDTNDGTGGNDGQWSGSIASNNIKSDNSGWTFANAGGANKCAKFGTGKAKGSAKTPSITINGDAKLTFKAAAWNVNSEATTLNLSATSGTLSKSSVELTKASWTEYKVTITGVTESTQITFEANNASNNRFFLDEVMVEELRSREVTIGATSAGYTTLFLDYATTIPAGAEAYYLSAYDSEKDVIKATKLEGNVPANTGIIVKGTKGESYKFAESIESVAPVGTNYLYGQVTSYDEETFTTDDGWYYLATDGTFWKYKGAATKKAYKAYLLLTEREWSSTSEAKGMRVVFDTETNIENIDTSADDKQAIYNLGGQKLNKLQKGINIVNGKKVYVQ